MSLQDHLRKLGRLDADEIARRFLAARIRGSRDHARKCPLCCWLTKCGVEQPTVTYSVVEGYGLRDEEKADTPESVAEFARRFDAGEWDQLEG